MLITLAIVVLLTALATGACVFIDLPSLPREMVTAQRAVQAEVPAQFADIQQVGSLRVVLEPITVKVAASAPPEKPKQNRLPKPMPPLTFPMKLIGIVLSDSRSQAVLQARDQSLHTLSVGDDLPAPHSAMQVKTIEADAVTFRQGQQTVRVQVKPRVP